MRLRARRRDAHELADGCNGAAFAYARRLAGLRQEDLAEILGVSRRTVIRWETPGAVAPLEAWEVIMAIVPPAAELLRELAQADSEERDRLFFSFVDRHRLREAIGEDAATWADADRLREARGVRWAELAGCIADPAAMVRAEYRALRAGDAVRFRILRGLRAWFALTAEAEWWGEPRQLPPAGPCPFTYEQLRRIAEWIFG